MYGGWVVQCIKIVRRELEAGAILCLCLCFLFYGYEGKGLTGGVSTPDDRDACARDI